MNDVKQVTIAGTQFPIRTPYAEGHVLTAGEAKQLNQVRTENVANNLRKQVKELLEASKTAEAAEAVAKYDSEYEMTIAAVGARRVTDPVEREALKIAREIITNKLKEKGKKLKDVDQDALQAKIEEVAATEGVQKVAKKRVADRQKLDIDVDIDIEDAAPEASDESEAA